jgi:hypothetical protein
VEYVKVPSQKWLRATEENYENRRSNSRYPDRFRKSVLAEYKLEALGPTP